MSANTENANQETNTGPSLDDLQSQLATLQVQLAESNSKLTTTIKERDAAKKRMTDAGADKDYKALYEELNTDHTGLLGTVKSTAVTAAAQAQLLKAGVLPEAVDAAVRLLDGNLIEWDKESGVDATSLTAAVQKVKSAHGFLFEKKVNKTTPKDPADGTQAGEKEINRADFDKLGAVERIAKMRAGFKVI